MSAAVWTAPCLSGCRMSKMVRYVRWKRSFRRLASRGTETSANSASDLAWTVVNVLVSTSACSRRALLLSVYVLVVVVVVSSHSLEISHTKMCYQSPEGCPNVSPEAQVAVKVLQTVLDASPLAAFDKVTHLGYWRQVLVRNVTSGDVMVMVQVNTEAVDPEQHAAAVESVKAAFAEAKAGGLQLVSLLLQPYNGINNAAPPETPVEVLFGADCIYEKCLGLQFRISPTAFFQVNTLGAERLYNVVRDWCAARADQTVLDICCGTGTIGLCMARSVAQVVGVEMVAAAVQDAEVNAKLNSVSNVKFICSKAEDATQQLLKQFPDCIGVVDPPRSGLHPSVCHYLRNTPLLKRLVYVSCNPDAFVDNAATYVLC
eukprot:TRINITY_DN1559_c1_g1_i1.p1 TRINITY_DN1559_c1_g1~~TRINITY_DN1559_c1_g1_i1.p1  ORF type:complete len:373 (-),score=68.63 TRINITY_DN1559_c1_g1_i1:38-1156(-)